MNIAVVEDSRREAEELIRFLEQFGKKHGCDLRISYYMNGEDFLASLGKNDYTAVFLDIFLGKMRALSETQ